MITVTTLYQLVPGLTEAELEKFLAAEWIRPARLNHQPVFSELDLARIRMIQDLRTTLEVEERTLPLVLALLDQLYTTRRRLRRVLTELDEPVRRRLVEPGDG
jgi:chaperone modulatory protein CbpM